MILMQRLSREFEAQSGIKLNWVVLGENILRQRLTVDISTGGNTFDVITIGSYEAPLWAERGWLLPVDDLGADYDYDDIFDVVRQGLSYKGKLYAAPFYAESSFTYYRKDLFRKAGLEMPEQPSYEQIRRFAARLNDPAHNVYGICLRGEPGWGQNMAYLSTLVYTFGGRWMDLNWRPQLTSPAWIGGRELLCGRAEKVRAAGRQHRWPQRSPGAVRQRQLRHVGGRHFGGGLHSGPQPKPGGRDHRFRQGPHCRKSPTARPGPGVGRWRSPSLPRMRAPPSSSSSGRPAEPTWLPWARATAGCWRLPERENRLTRIRHTSKAAPFAELVREAILTADMTRPSALPVPYIGIQYVGIPEFQAIGTDVGQEISAALTGGATVEQALALAQAEAERAMRRGGYLK